MPKRILSIIGTRPEAIKMAPLIRRLAASPAFEQAVCVTAQHRSMLDDALDRFAIRPDYDLDLMLPNRPLSHLAASVLEGVDAVLSEHRPDVVLVHGDTTTTLGAALAAFHRQITVGHVEAGLRSGEFSRPWPEEMNRRLVDGLAQLLFAPTARARDNLLAEGLQDRKIVVTGNTGIDALLDAQKIIDGAPGLSAEFQRLLPPLPAGRKLILVTAHRRESYGDGLRDVCGAIRTLAERSDVAFLFPVHRNPNVRDVVYRQLTGIDNVFMIDPLDYFSFVQAIGRSHLVLTDSGGIQEEAPVLGKPVLVLREVTERQEGVEAGTAQLVGTSQERIVEAVAELLDNPDSYARMARAHKPYGDGHACDLILEELLHV